MRSKENESSFLLRSFCFSFLKVSCVVSVVHLYIYLFFNLTRLREFCFHMYFFLLSLSSQSPLFTRSLVRSFGVFRSDGISFLFFSAVQSGSNSSSSSITEVSTINCTNRWQNFIDLYTYFQNINLYFLYVCVCVAVWRYFPSWLQWNGYFYFSFHKFVYSEQVR